MEQLLLSLFSIQNILMAAIILTIFYFLFIKEKPASQQKEKHVIIIGGGFAGVAATLRLLKKLGDTSVKITLINKHTYHLFTPSLYEFATSEIHKKNVAIPLTKIFPNGVKIIHDIVDTIDPLTNSLTLQKHDALSYDYLIIAAGSQPAYMGIPGLKEYGMGFKSLQDGKNIRDKIKDLCCEDGKCNRKVQVVIGGGGFAGTELAAELLTYKDKIAQQHRLDKDCLEMTIIQGSDKLLKELDPRVSNLAEKRLQSPRVHFAFGGHIKEVTKTHVLTDNGKSFPYEILIWTGGVVPNGIGKVNNFPITHRGGIIVNNYLQMKGYDSIFVAGDVAAFVDPKTDRPAPNVAQVAEEQGQIAGENVASIIKNEAIKPYRFRHWGYVVPLKGYFAAAELVHNIHLTGIAGWLLQQAVLFRYLLGILPPTKAIKYFTEFEMDMDK